MVTRKRKTERRLDLIEAARRAMVQYGTDAVHLSQVAEEAGLTSGAVLYHYPELSDLLLEAHHAGMERFYDQRMKKIAGIADPAEKLVVTVRSGLPSGPDDADVRLLCELGGSAGRNRVYATLLTTLFDRQVTMYQLILETGAAQGVFTLSGDSQTISRNLVALEDAYGYRIVARHPMIGTDEATELILDYARQATGHPLPGALAKPPVRRTRQRAPKADPAPS
ncbi:helix-turn-helix domain-containing protein [Actinocorallia sp. A-T 12471]|uniref:TetR/AcrR family transcriptional regulator n=1 Tax=Actinocorallia sp. A-T 12471 TaxID=3089813 RepID=UPI0029D1DF7E|nr:helix-turn-helix domain-containing protein [Actinocorallia sp. A-T 12471]MDX6744786.1 helix-turn-helix domain-containing protein [Actinocorallia sp. A-T 12471]